MTKAMLLVFSAACVAALPALAEAKSAHRHRASHARTRVPAATGTAGAAGGTMPGAYRY